MKWPKDRRTELLNLQSLLTEVSYIDHGSGVIERLQHCISIAENLTATDLHTGRDSFFQFLVKQCAGEV